MLQILLLPEQATLAPNSNIPVSRADAHPLWKRLCDVMVHCSV
jgi:hypothetical protein